MNGSVVESVEGENNSFMLMPSGPCAHFISQSFKQRVDPEGYAWGKVSKEMCELYWEEFQKKCCWDETIDSLVRQAWARKAAESYEEYKLKSEKNKKNRRNGVADGVAKPTYNAGSASHLKIASDLKRKLGRDPSHSELFLYIHTKNDDGAAYTEKQEELEAESVEFEEDKLFYAVVGGHDKKKTLWITLFCKGGSQ
ncbi:uncharacterized protein LOC111898000 [Lactuca sativa]|uniref:uncharacterized protein LOC111898000 n=1 Tax=Lactuca sativa TaxID=4236 RepID=UPI000CD9E67F|nr:uncharacterized protein LOC111898000 [Lactuca sativa]